MANQSMANQEGSGYERLGAAKLSAMGLHRPVRGIHRARVLDRVRLPVADGCALSVWEGGRGRSAPCGPDLRGRHLRARAGSWLNTRNGSMRRARCTTTCRTGSDRPSARRQDGSTTAGRSSLTVGLGVLIGGFIHDTILTEFDKEPLPVWAWNVIWAVAAVLRPVLGGEALNAAAARRSRSCRCSCVLAFIIYVIAKVGGGNDLGKAFDPSGSTTGNLSGVLFGVLYGRADLRGVRNRGESGGGDVANRSARSRGPFSRRWPSSRSSI